MALFRTLHRAAFICNLCFLLALFILWLKHPVNAGLTSLILVLGFFVSVLLNVVVNLWLIVLKITNKPLSQIPRWLIYVNGGFLVIQLVLLFR
jgi:hypothetical protein